MHQGENTSRNVSSSQRRNRRRYQRAVLETLEPRTLLTAFSGTDVSGTWSFNSLGAAGVIQFDSTNAIVTGSLTDEAGTPILPVGNYTISSTGDIILLANGNTYTGGMNATRDAIVLSRQGTGGLDFSNSQLVLIRDDDTGFTNANVTGTWGLFLTGDAADNTGQGNIVFDGNGHITGGTATDINGLTTVTGGTYSVSQNGAITASIITNSTNGAGTLTVSGQLNSAHDLIAVSPTDLVAAASANDTRLLVFVRSAGTYANTDLTGTWNFNGDSFGGSLVFNGNGSITGGTGVAVDGTARTFTGTYAVSTGGSFNLTIVAHNGTNSQSFVEHGILSASKSLAAMEPTPVQSLGSSSADSLIIMTSAANHLPTLTTMTPFLTAFSGHPFSFTFADLVSHGNAADLDGDTLSFSITNISNGTLTLNGSAVNATPVTVGAGSTLQFTPASNVSGSVTGFSIAAFDGTSASTPVVPVVFTTITTPTITLAVTKATASEINHTSAASTGLFTITRSNGILSSALDVTVALTGTATNGADYTTVNTEVHFSANQTTAVVAIHASSDAFAEGSETAVLTVVTSDTGSTYDISPTHHAGTVTLADAASTITAAVTKAKASELNGSTSGMGQFTLTRAGGDLTGSQVVTFTLSGTADATHFNIPTSGTLTFNATTGTGTVTFAAGQKTATIPFFPVNDIKADAPALNVVLTVTPDSSTSSYFLGAVHTANINIADVASTVTASVSKAKASEINGSTSGMGQFTLTRAGGNLAVQQVVTFTLTGTADATHFNIPTSGTLTFNASTGTGTVTFAAGQKTANIPFFPVNDHVAHSPNLNVVLTVTPDNTTSSYFLGAVHTATVDIADSANTLTVSVSKPKASELHGSTTGQGQFTITRTGGDLTVSQLVTFSITGTAGQSHFNIPSVSGLTFNGTTGSVLLAPGQKTFNVPFSPIDDGLANTPAPTVILTVTPDSSTASYLIGAVNHATVTIADTAPTVSVTAKTPLKVVNGSVSRLGQFSVVRKGLDVTTTEAVVFTLSGSAVDLSRYTVVTSGGVTFDTGSKTGTITLTPGQTTGTVTVNPTDHVAANATADALIFTLVADGGPTYFINPLLSAAAGDLTSTYSASVTKAHASELNGSTSGMGQFTVTRKGGDLSRPVTVDFSISGTSSGLFAVSGVNYDILTSANVTFNASTGTGTIVFAAGKASVDVPFNSINDLQADIPLSQGGPRVQLVVHQDAPHTFLVDPAKTSSNIIIADAASVISATVTKQASEINGSTSGMGVVTFVRSGGDLKAPLTVNFNLGGTAAEGTDYNTIATHSITFAPNQTKATLNILPKEDVDVVEGNETVQVVLQPDSNFTYFIDIAKSTPEVTIANDTRGVLLGTLSNLTGATHNVPHVIFYADLVAATQAQVPAGGTLTFKVTKVLKGTLQKNAAPIVLNGPSTIIGAGETFSYTSPSAGNIKAFNVVALNGTATSATLTITIQTA